MAVRKSCRPSGKYEKVGHFCELIEVVGRVYNGVVTKPTGDDLQRLLLQQDRGGLKGHQRWTVPIYWARRVDSDFQPS